jgi:porin
VQDLNARFYATDAAAALRNGTFGLGAELAGSGVNGVATFPLPALGALIEAHPLVGWDVVVGAFDGVPGDPADPRGTHLRIGADEGALVLAELGRGLAVNGQTGRIAAGGWRYTRAQAAVGGAGEGRSAGAYLAAEQKLYSPVRGREDGLRAFVRAGAADPATNAVARSGSAGLSWRGWLVDALDDEVAFGVAVAALGEAGRAAAAAEADSSLELAAEQAWELTYRFRPLPWLVVQPDVQHVRRPGFRAQAPAEWVGAARLELAI